MSSRIIKFRAWDRQEKCWIDSFCISKSGLFGTLWYPKSPSPDWWNDDEFKDRITLQQYTGLHDKHGKEVYEGDIVKWPYYKKHRTGEVVYGTCGFWIQGYLDILEMRTGEIEVIGNIYEKP